MDFKANSLPDNILAIVKDKGTEYPFSGIYHDFEGAGTYLCRLCGLALFRAASQFHSGCGWPSFDENITGAVLCVPDQDGKRTEILCSRCLAHLGHVFVGENFTLNNTRHCVNTLSMDYINDQQVLDTQEAIFAAGCFWGVEYFFKRLPGVLKTEVGYIGGHKKFPSYQEVCAGTTGHLEAIRVIFDPLIINYEKLVKFYFEIHNFEQTNGQGPDIGEQYLSAIFYFDEKQQQTSLSLITELSHLGYRVATRVKEMSPFWPAEEYHQQYYEKNGKNPYCHWYEKKFES